MVVYCYTIVLTGHHQMTILFGHVLKIIRFDPLLARPFCLHLWITWDMSHTFFCINS
ncbi:hypothetical protein HanPSC8_Chr12g0538941 [Helianthus annuus]|nr:hypothetical protein HanPSC8_Chr12g0538941 [Helianthus annuus]